MAIGLGQDRVDICIDSVLYGFWVGDQGFFRPPCWEGAGVGGVIGRSWIGGFCLDVVSFGLEVVLVCCLAAWQGQREWDLTGVVRFGVTLRVGIMTVVIRVSSQWELFFMSLVRLIAVMAMLAVTGLSLGAEPSSRVLKRFDAAEAVQAVAVDGSHFYAIANTVIGKYDKETGGLVARWKASDEASLRHMNAGIVLDGKLYCAHSNYPHFPEASSVEIFDTATLEHVGNHSLGIYEGSLTWIDWHDDAWWAVFAHYSSKVNDAPFAKPHAYTSLVKFDREWRRMAGWVFPEEVLDLFAPQSCSGGGWGPDGQLYCTGHDRPEIYQMALPQAGSALVLKRTIPVEITGQGVAWDKSRPGVLYGISRVKKQVIVSEVLAE